MVRPSNLHDIIMKTIIACLLFLGNTTLLIASGNDSLYHRLTKPVNQDAHIQWLLDTHRRKVSNERGIQGFRVQVYMDSGNQARLKTQRARAEFEQKFPEVSVYITYDEPNFRLRVGDFRTRLDARRFLEAIAKDYPDAYIVVDMINFPDLDETEITRSADN